MDVDARDARKTVSTMNESAQLMLNTQEVTGIINKVKQRLVDGE